jgi:hypothetical protein
MAGCPLEGLVLRSLGVPDIRPSDHSNDLSFLSGQCMRS